MKSKITIFCLLFCGLLYGGTGLVVSENDHRERNYGAQILNEEYGNPFENNDQFIRIGNGSFVEEMRRLFYNNFLPMFRYVIGFAAILIWTIYIITMISAAGSSDTLSEQRKNLIWGIVGFIVIALAVEFGNSLAPVDNGTDIIQIDETELMIRKVVAYMQMAITILAIGVIFYAGANLVRAQSEEEDISTSKKLIMGAVLGIVVAMLASPIVNIFYPPDRTLDDQEVIGFAQQFASFLSFFLTFLAVGAFTTLIIAGMYYVTSFGEEERQEKAKSIIGGTLVGIIVILTAYAIVSTFVPS